MSTPTVAELSARNRAAALTGHTLLYSRGDQRAVERRDGQVVNDQSLSGWAWDVAQRIASANAHDRGARFLVADRQPESRSCVDCGDPLTRPGRRCTTCQVAKDFG